MQINPKDFSCTVKRLITFIYYNFIYLLVSEIHSAWHSIALCWF